MLSTQYNPSYPNLTYNQCTPNPYYPKQNCVTIKLNIGAFYTSQSKKKKKKMEKSWISWIREVTLLSNFSGHMHFLVLTV